MSIQANNIDPIDVKEELKKAIGNEANKRGIQCINAYQRALESAQRLYHEVIAKHKKLYTEHENLKKKYKLLEGKIEAYENPCGCGQPSCSICG